LASVLPLQEIGLNIELLPAEASFVSFEEDDLDENPWKIQQRNFGLGRTTRNFPYAGTFGHMFARLWAQPRNQPFKDAGR
jgi:hypothetical protein